MGQQIMLAHFLLQSSLPATLKTPMAGGDSGDDPRTNTLDLIHHFRAGNQIAFLP